MKKIYLIACVILLFGFGYQETGNAASAKCVVVNKSGTVLVMDCGDRGESIPNGANVKVKTDRDSPPPRQGN